MKNTRIGPTEFLTRFLFAPIALGCLGYVLWSSTGSIEPATQGFVIRSLWYWTLCIINLRFIGQAWD